jgi:hypothetical protein
LKAQQRGFSLVLALLVVTMATLLVVGAIGFTGMERESATIESRSEAISACTQLARNRFLSKMRVLGSVKDLAESTDVGSTIRFMSGHFDSATAQDPVKAMVTGSTGARDVDVNDFSNRVGPMVGLLHNYTLTAVCIDISNPNNPYPPKVEVEFGLRIATKDSAKSGSL